jgi:pheromone a factor receptor
MVSVFPSFTIPGFIAAALVLIPLPRQIRVGNVATIAMTFWLFQHCFAASIDTIIWNKNVLDVAPVWCDISECARHPTPKAVFILSRFVQLPRSGTAW